MKFKDSHAYSFKGLESVSADMDANVFNLLYEWKNLEEKLLVKKIEIWYLNCSLDPIVYFIETVDTCRFKNNHYF